MGLVLEMRVESQGRAWIPRPTPLSLGRLACVWRGLIIISVRAVRLSGLTRDLVMMVN